MIDPCGAAYSFGYQAGYRDGHQFVLRNVLQIVDALGEITCRLSSKLDDGECGMLTALHRHLETIKLEVDLRMS